ncbi:MAG: hypothetical protein HOO92_06800 [Methylococcaceae bacterium]|nr:hypothetical protein [Methylococcaceae bacterium]
MLVFRVHIYMVMLALYSSVSLAATMFDVHAPLPDSITWVVYKGEAYQQLLVRANDPQQPQWGDGRGGRLAKRAQLMPAYRDPLGSTKDVRFHFLVPDDWKMSLHPVLIAGGHSVNLKAGPWALYIEYNKVQFTISIDNPNGKEPDSIGSVIAVVNERFPLVIDHLYEFRLVEHVSKDMTGYAKVYLDGKQVVDYRGPTVSTMESGLPYEEIGPYVFNHSSKWPFPNEDHKRLLIRIP